MVQDTPNLYGKLRQEILHFLSIILRVLESPKTENRFRKDYRALRWLCCGVTKQTMKMFLSIIFSTPVHNFGEH